jgi:hypothetical protein
MLFTVGVMNGNYAVVPEYTTSAFRALAST